MEIIWLKEKHSINIPLIDKQHQEIFLITNLLCDVDGSKEIAERKKNILSYIKRLYAYCNYHFNTEEDIFMKYKYPEAAEHKKIHNDFTLKVKEKLAEVKEHLNPEIKDTIDFLVDWIITHIMGEDKKYADYFKEKNITIEADSEQAANALKLWNEKKLFLEIKGIDDQHKELIMILQQVNDLYRANQERKNAFLPIIIKKMFYYSQYHFSYEEELMSKHMYSEIDEHKKLHNYFIKQILHFTDEYKKGIIGLLDELLFFLRDWTINHILEEDKKFKLTLN
jgi:hemerythrin